jgi:RimJ/RimL family protein N-acetyltransferase
VAGRACEDPRVNFPAELTTARLELRPWRAGDADAHAAIWRDPSVWSSLRPEGGADPEEESARSLAKQVRQWEKHGFGIWALTPRGEGQPVGWAGAWYPDFVPDVMGEIEIGWSLRHDYWGRGYATEAARQAVEATFEHIGPDRVISLIAPANDRSAAVAGRLGMRHASTSLTDENVELRVFELARPPNA